MRMNRRAAIGLGLAAAGTALAGVAKAEGLETEGDAARYAAALEDIRAYAGRHVAVYGLPGLTLALTDDKGFAAYLRFGLSDVERGVPVGPDQLFQIGSISKSFTALAVFRAMEAGKVSLDADMRDLLPGVPWPSDGPTTVQSLLSHGSGLPDDAPIFPRGGDQKLWRGFAPGSHWSYSNLGYMLLGELAAKLDGRPLPEVLQARVLDPLQLTATRPAILTADRARYAGGYAPYYSDRAYPRAGRLAPGPWTDMVEGSGCVASTARDMARYSRFLIAAGQGRGGPLLSDAGAARFVKPVLEAPGWAVKGAWYANGLAVVPVGGRPLLHHTGGMLLFSSSIHVDPKAGVAAFASANVGGTGYRPREITAYACERLRAVVEASAPPAPPPAPPPPKDLSAFAGRYAARDGGQLVVAVTSSPGIRVQAAHGALQMEPSGDGAFIATDPPLAEHPLVFRQTGGVVQRAWWGETEYVRLGEAAPVAAYTPPTSPGLRALTGHYVNDDPWRGGFRVTAQGEALFVDGTTPLVPRAGGSYRLGEADWSPERAWFGPVAEGKVQRVNISGVDYLRR